MAIKLQLSSKSATDKDFLTVLNKELIPAVKQLIDRANGVQAPAPPGAIVPELPLSVDWNLGLFGDAMGHYVHGSDPLTDLSGHLNDLTVVSGARNLAQPIDGQNFGSHVPASWILGSDSSDFRTLGAITISCVVRLVDPLVYGVLACSEGPGAGAPDNMLYDFGLSSGGIYWGQENGVKAITGPGPGPNYFSVIPSCGEPVMLTCTRDTSGVLVNLYLGKMLAGSGELATPPLDGSASNLRLFADGTSTNDLANFYAYSTSIYPYEMGADEVLALHKFRRRI